MEKNVKADEQTPMSAPTSRLIDWYAIGQGCEIEIEGATVRFHVVGQKGGRVRIAVVAPPAATFTNADGSQPTEAHGYPRRRE
jgi:hypothetical protein